MIRVGIVGLGKMGISHLAMFQAHPDVEIGGVADTSRYALDVLAKYTGIATYPSVHKMLDRAGLDAVVIATPTHLHGEMVRAALERDLHVFCEKPFSLDPDDGLALADLAEAASLVTQVGYHNRFVAAFAEAKRLVDAGAIGTVSRAHAEAYGPVVLKPPANTWRTRRGSGGGCLYDYAAHPVDLLTWYLGEPVGANGSRLIRVFSPDSEDEVLSTLRFPDGVSAQLAVSWSDESHRKMTTQVSLWGTLGRISVDRQEIRVYLRDGAETPAGYRAGWNVRYTTELSESTWYYLRGEEYSAQVDAFVRRARTGRSTGLNSFREALVTDRALAMILADATDSPVTPSLLRNGDSTPGRPARAQALRTRWSRQPARTR